MGSFNDLLGTINSAFQIGLQSAGDRTLQFRNQFLGRLRWNPTADRLLTLPDRDGIIATSNVLDEVVSFGERNIAFGNTIPPVEQRIDKLLWFEPSQYPQPWEYDAFTTRWRSSPQIIDLIPWNFGTGGITLIKLFPSTLPFVWIDNFVVRLRTNGSSGNVSTNFYSFSLRLFRRNGTNVTISSGNNQSQALGTSRNFENNYWSYIDEPAYIEMAITRSGSATGLSITSSAYVGLKYVRLS